MTRSQGGRKKERWNAHFEIMMWRKENDGNFSWFRSWSTIFCAQSFFSCVGHSTIKGEEKQMSEIILSVDQALELKKTRGRERSEENENQPKKTSFKMRLKLLIYHKVNRKSGLKPTVRFSLKFQRLLKCFEQSILTSWNFLSSFFSLSFLCMTNWLPAIKTFLLIPSLQDSLPYASKWAGLSAFTTSARRYGCISLNNIIKK